MKGILLDTHIWIWLMEGMTDLAMKHRKMINAAASRNELFIAAISLWEISMLVAKKRIILEKPILTWIQEALNLPGTSLKALTPEIATESCQLPENFNGDPADRLIVATARVHGLDLLTYDKKIIAYSKKQYISVLK